MRLKESFFILPRLVSFSSTVKSHGQNNSSSASLNLNRNLNRFRLSLNYKHA